MCGLLKIPSTSTFLAAQNAVSRQQMLFHGNHRNLLLFCHSFQVHNSRLLNTTQCCLPLGNMASKQRFLILAARGLRSHKVGSSGDGEKTEEKSADSSENDDMTDKLKFLIKFEAELLKFLQSCIKKESEKKAGERTTSWAKLMSNVQNEFVDKFNKENAGSSGYKIERGKQDKYEKMYVAAPHIGFLLLFVYFCYLLRPRGNVKRKHRRIVAQPPLTFGQFVEEYLPAGKVETIFHYPKQNLAVAILRPDAGINGESFKRPAAGLHIALDDSFRFQPAALAQRIWEEERRIGVQNPIGIHQVWPKNVLFFCLAAFALFLIVQGMQIRSKFIRNFHAVPIKTKGRPN